MSTLSKLSSVYFSLLTLLVNFNSDSHESQFPSLPLKHSPKYLYVFNNKDVINFTEKNHNSIYQKMVENNLGQH